MDVVDTENNSGYGRFKKILSPHHWCNRSEPDAGHRQDLGGFLAAAGLVVGGGQIGAESQNKRRNPLGLRLI
jgi:hypothetical protein